MYYKMLKGVILFIVAVTACTLGQTFDDAVPKDLRNTDFNTYYVYTRPLTTVPIPITDYDLTILQDRPLLVLIHGHDDSYRAAMNVEITRGILEIAQEDVNVLLVDWSTPAGYKYSSADAAVPLVGRYLADFLSSLSLVSVTPDRMHIAGFDLGAHVAGWAGRTLRERDTPVARITAMDPSKSNNRLSRTDATYVEVIHTDGAALLTGGNGIGEQMGHADFFPNGGRSQPGCWTNTCSHNRSWQLFAASMGWKTFVANCCNSMKLMRSNSCRTNSFQEMGNNKLVKLIGSCGTGIYRVNTKSSFPY